MPVNAGIYASPDDGVAKYVRFKPKEELQIVRGSGSHSSSSSLLPPAP